MRIIPRYLLAVLLLFVVASARAGEQPLTLDLREVSPILVTVSDKQVSLVITGHPPRVLMFSNSAPSGLAVGDKPGSKRLRVTYGGDLVGFARLLKAEPRASLVDASLLFETEEQAIAAGKALRPGSTKPSPLPRAKKK